MEILPLDRSRAAEAVKVFNRENERFEFVAKLTVELFESQVASKNIFDPETSFLAVEDGRPLGFALGCAGRGEDDVPDAAIGAVDGLFFPEGRLHVGDELLDKCVKSLKMREARTIYGFASRPHYPFWRGIYFGAEPVCASAYTHAWATFMAHGFEHHQQSFTFLGPVRPGDYQADLDYQVSALDVSTPWLQESWKGLSPRTISARADGEEAGRIGFVFLPWISQRRGISTAGIASLWVNAAWRRRGIASSLMHRLFELLKQEEVEDVLVGTTVQNIAARRTYEKAGMRVVGFRTGTRYEVKPGRRGTRKE